MADKLTRLSVDRERRPAFSAPGLRKDGDESTVYGYAAMYNSETVIYGMWREQIAPGAFETALNGEDDVRALFNHDPNMVLGRTPNTLTLSEDAKGLRYEIKLPKTQVAQDVRELIKRGDVTGSSFGFSIIEEEWDETPTKKGQLPLVTIRKVELFDVSPVTYPAYPQTSVKARAKGEAAAADIQAFAARMDAVGRRDLQRARIALERAWR